MGTISDVVRPAFVRCRESAEKLAAGIPQDKAARKPHNGQGIIETNHPTFIFGHLGLYPPRVLALLGIDARSLEPDNNLIKLFDHSAQCLDDVRGDVYPSFADVTRSYFSATDRLIELLPGIDDDTLARPHPDETRRARFPTLGSWVVYLSTVHPALHLGQLSAWRRCMGLGPA